MFHKCILPLFVVIFSCSVYATGIPIGLIPYQCFFKGKVIRVLDGDTIEVLQENKPVRVRLANIDAPEKNRLTDTGQRNSLKVWLQHSLLL